MLILLNVTYDLGAQSQDLWMTWCWPQSVNEGLVLVLDCMTNVSFWSQCWGGLGSNCCWGGVLPKQTNKGITNVKVRYYYYYYYKVSYI